MSVKGIFKVIYAPQKAFKELAQNPKYIGIFVLLLLVVLANMAFIYIAISKEYVEETFPKIADKDVWTENKTLWTSELPDVVISENFDDFINGTVYGNRSIQFSAMNNSRMSMQLDNIGPVNCSEPNGFKSLFVRVKQTVPEANPENVTIYLFSASSSYFYCNFTQGFSGSTINQWNNLTIGLREGWSNSSLSANWGNITGLKMEFSWLTNSNVTLLVDGLFFRGIFKSLLETSGAEYFTAYPIYVFTQFVFNWLLLGAFVYLMSRGLGGKVSWKTISILVGYTLVALLVQALINVAAYAALPPLYYRLELIGGVGGESNAAYNELMNAAYPIPDIVSYAQIATRIWSVILCIFAVRAGTELSWGKSILVAAAGYMITILIVGILLGFVTLGF